MTSALAASTVATTAPDPHRTLSPAAQSVHILICASQAATLTSPFGTMEQIRQAALRHNPPQGIHSVLIHQSGWFVHWVEGPPDAVHALVTRVGRDPRHHGQRVLHHSRGARHLPSPWSMMLSASTEPAPAFGERVDALGSLFEQGRQYAPTSTIRRLVAPLRLPEMAHRAGTDSFHRIGVCAAAANEAFALVRWLAAQNDEPMAQRRFAGELDLDSASDAVEFLQDGQPCRVIAISRQGLLHGVRRAFLPDWTALLLLLSGEPARDLALMTRVTEACAGLPRVPPLLAVAPDAATHEAAAARALAHGLQYSVLGEIPPDDFTRIWRGMRSQLRALGAPPQSGWSTLEADL